MPKVTQTEHTQGKWVVVNGECGSVYVTAGGIPVALLYLKDIGLLGPGISKAERAKNAALVAAAPGLLEACKFFVANYHCRCSDGTCPHCVARAEIAKAERTER